MTSLTMKRLMSLSVSTKRATTLVSGLRGTPVTYLTGVKCMPIDPVSIGETRERLTSMELDSPIELYQTVTSGVYDIIKGDILTSGSTDYAIKDVENWGEETSYLGSTYKRLILEKVKP